MKKIIMTAAVLACAATVVQAQVSSANIVGYTKHSLTGGSGELYIMSSEWETATVEEILGLGYAGATSTGNRDISKSTQVFYFDNVTGYIPLYLYDQGNAGTNTEWRFKNDVEVRASDMIVSNGAAFFLQPYVGEDFVFSGNVNTQASVTNSIAVGDQLLSYPYSTGVDNIANLTLLQSGTPTTEKRGDIKPGLADRLYLFRNGGYEGYFLFDDGFEVAWRSMDDVWSVVSVEDLPGIAHGEGFFYQAVNAFDWIENTPYPNVNN